MYNIKLDLKWVVYYEVQLVGCSLGLGLVNRVMNLSFVKVWLIDQLTGTASVITLTTALQQQL